MHLEFRASQWGTLCGMIFHVFCEEVVRQKKIWTIYWTTKPERHKEFNLRDYEKPNIFSLNIVKRYKAHDNNRTCRSPGKAARLKQYRIVIFVLFDFTQLHFFLSGTGYQALNITVASASCLFQLNCNLVTVRTGYYALNLLWLPFAVCICLIVSAQTGCDSVGRPLQGHKCFVDGITNI